jgi:hypothetical protein
MADKETDKTRRRGFARAFTAGTYGKGNNGGRGGARKNLILPVIAILLFAGGAVAIGALASHKSGAVSDAANVNKVSVAAPVAAARPSPATAGNGTPRLKAASATPGAQSIIGSAGSGLQPWTPPGQEAPAPSSFQGSTGSGGPVAARSAAGGSGSAVSRIVAKSPDASASAKPSSRTKVKTVTAAAAPAVSPAPSTPSAKWVVITGQVNCTSGNPIVGFWIKAADGRAGWANWMVVSSGPNADYWLSVPPDVPVSGYQMSVGCGGTQQSWKIPTYSKLVTGTHNSFHCDDVPGTAGYKECTLR